MKLPSISLSDISVLVVDDKEPMRAVIVTVLQDLRFGHILQAENGREALSLLHQQQQSQLHPVHLIIADWKMPKMDGLELLRQIREDDKLRDIPFLMVTAQNDETSVLQARSLGVSDYIVKPFHAKTLESKIRKIFGI